MAFVNPWLLIKFGTLSISLKSLFRSHLAFEPYAILLDLKVVEQMSEKKYFVVISSLHSLVGFSIRGSVYPRSCWIMYIIVIIIIGKIQSTFFCDTFNCFIQRFLSWLKSRTFFMFGNVLRDTYLIIGQSNF